MKKRFCFILTIAALALVMVLSMAACGEDEVKPVSIRVDGATLKSTYRVGDTPDWEKARIIVTYSDGHEEPVAITSGMLNASFDSETEGKRNLTIVYNNLSYLFSYTVIPDEATTHIVTAAVTGATTTYKLNEGFNYTGTLTATFGDGATGSWALADLKRVLTVSGFRSDKAGDYQCQLSYESAMGTITVEYAYTVAPLASIVSASYDYIQPIKTFEGDSKEEFVKALSQHAFHLYYADGTEEDVYVKAASAVGREFTTEQPANNLAVTITVTDSMGRNTKVSVQYSVQERYEVYTVTFDPNFDGVLPFREQTDESTGKIDQQSFDRRGYLCLGWFVGGETGERWDFNAVVTEDITLVARWMLQEYYIRIYSFGVPYGSPRYYTVDQTVVLDTPTAVNGYSFLYYTFKGTPIAGNTIYPGTWAENLELTAVWEAIEYRVEYQLHDSPAYPVQNASEFSVATYTTQDARNLPEPIRPGYNFMGWSMDAAGTQTITTLGGQYGDVILHANWSANTYYVYFVHDATGEAVPGRAPRAFSVNSTNIEITPAEIAGYRFEGWYTDAACTDTFYRQDGKYYLLSGSHTESFTLYAKTTPVYTLYLSGDTTAKLQFAIGEDDTAAYQEAWRAASQSPCCDLVYWEYAGDGNSAPLRLTVTEGDGVTLSATTEELALYDGKTLTAVWQGHQRTITYKYGYDVPDEVVTYDTLEGITLSMPTRGGYRFAGWKRNSQLEGETITEIAPRTYDRNLIFYAKWTLLSNTLTFHYRMDDDLLRTKMHGMQSTSAYSVDTITYTAESADIEFSPLPKADFFSFGGWYTTIDYAGSRVNSLPTGSYGITDLYAKWSPIQYKVTFAAVGGTAFGGVLNEQQLSIVNYRTEQLVLYTPTRAGYTFGGWYLDAAGTEACPTNGDNQSVVDLAAIFAACDEAFAADDGIERSVVTVYAKWDAIPYTIKFNSGKIGTKTITTDYNPNSPATTASFSVENVMTLEPATANGYVFQGWFSAVSGGTQILSTAGIYQNIEVYPQWLKGTYTITYADFDNATVAALSLPTTYQLEGTLDTTNEFSSGLTTKMKRFGYTLTGVYSGGAAVTMLGSNKPNGTNAPYCADIVLTGAWTAIEYTVALKYQNSTKTSFVVYTAPEWGSDKKTVTVDAIGNGMALPVMRQQGYVDQTEWYADTALTKPIGVDLTTDELAANLSGSGKTLTLYAGFVAAEYTITFHSNLEGMTAPEPAAFTYFGGYTLSPLTAPDGYRWIGWYLDDAFTQAVTAIAKNTYSTDVDVYGRAEVLHTITYVMAGANELSAPVSQFTMAAATTLPEATYSDKKFSGWYLEGVGNVGLTLPIGITHDVSLMPLFYTGATAGIEVTYAADGLSGVVCGYRGGASCTLPTAMGTAEMFAADQALPMTAIAAEALKGKNITSLTIPAGYLTIGNNAFENTKITALTLPATITSIGDSICKGCTALKNATINGGSIGTGSYLFSNCTALTTVTLNNCQIAADCNAFYKCNALTTVTLNCSGVGAHALGECTALTTLTIKGDVPLATMFYSSNDYPITLATLRISGSTLGVNFGDSIQQFTTINKVYLDSDTQVNVSAIESFLSTRVVYVPNALLAGYKALYPDWNIQKK